MGQIMRYAVSVVALAGALSFAATAAHGLQQSSHPAGMLTTVHIPQPVLANGRPLAAGLYELRVTDERPAPLPGQSPDAERWVEFLANKNVAAREVAEILRDDDLPSAGASSVRARHGTRVELLIGGEFLRISVKRGDERYLIHLPVVP
jgi:hypothetical protein